MGLFDKIRNAVGNTADAAADAGEAVVDAVTSTAGAAADSAADAAGDLVDGAPPPPTSIAFDARLGPASPIMNVGAAGRADFHPEEVPAPPSAEMLLPDVVKTPAAPGPIPIPYPNVGAAEAADEVASEAARFETEVFPNVIANAMADGRLSLGDDTRDGPGAVSSLRIGGVGPAPDEGPSYPDAIPNPLYAGASIPIPHPNLDTDDGDLLDLALPDIAVPDPGPLTVSFGDTLQSGSMVPVVGPPDELAADPTYVDLPDASIDAGDIDGTVDIDPMLPTPTVHGGTTIGGADIDADLDAPGLSVDADVQVVVEVDPMVTGLVPHVGGAAVGGDVTVDFDPAETPDVDVDAPSDDSGAMSAVDDFQADLQAIDDAADDLDIFD